MQLTTALVAFFTTSALAESISTFAATQWTLNGLSRVWDEADTSCTWTFVINPNEAELNVTDCTYTVTAAGTTQATQANGGPVMCGAYTITSGWSGQFGADQGFTVISVVDYPNKLIVYAGYTDASVTNGTVVTPDLSFPVQMLM